MHGSNVGGGTDEDFYDPATGGKVALMSAANCRPLPPHIQQLIAGGGGSGLIGCAPPGYYDEAVVESMTGSGTGVGGAGYPFHHVVHHQPYCGVAAAAAGPGRAHQHSPNCYAATDLSDPTMVGGRGDFMV